MFHQIEGYEANQKLSTIEKRPAEAGPIGKDRSKLGGELHPPDIFYID
jgi:hypothetical protein